YVKLSPHHWPFPPHNPLLLNELTRVYEYVHRHPQLKLYSKESPHLLKFRFVLSYHNLFFVLWTKKASTCNNRIKNSKINICLKIAFTAGGRFNFITVQGLHLFKRLDFHSINPILKWTQLFILKCIILIRLSTLLLIQRLSHLVQDRQACHLSRLMQC